MNFSPSRDCPVPTCARPGGDNPDELEASLGCAAGCLSGAIPSLPSSIARQRLSGRSDTSTVIGAHDVLRLHRRCELAEISALGRCSGTGIERRMISAGLIARRARSKRHQAKVAHLLPASERRTSSSSPPT